jgi:uncharacterized protein (TIGR02452 family)
MKPRLKKDQSMIKRDGVGIMNARTQNVKIAKDTIDISKNQKYTSVNGTDVDISQDMNHALEGTALYKYDSELPDTDWETCVPTIEVVNETTTSAAVRLAALGKTDLVALNFAAARNQGGGFLAGAMAQEEDLCRKSGLYSCLKRKPIFYNENILCDNTFYTHNIIYSPKVPFFRDEFNLLVDNPFTLSVITSPAPNVSAMKHFETEHGTHLSDSDEGLLGITLMERAERILEVAAAHGHKNIILGAWGCGAFGNDPYQVSKAFAYALKQVPAFEHVCFAVYDTREPQILFETFQKTFSNG